MSTAATTCPSCKMPVAPGSAYCENCGAALRLDESGEPQDQSGGASCPCEPHSTVATILQTSPDAPFDLEWDDARQFIAGSCGAFAFRMTFRCNLKSVEVIANVDGEQLPAVAFLSVEAGDFREGSIAFTPKRPGAVTVNLRIAVTMANHIRETFEPKCPLRSMTLSGKRHDVLGGDLTVNINADGNTGINRFDGVNFGGLAGVRIDNWNDERSVLERPPEWRAIPLVSCEVGCEAVVLCAGERTLSVSSGANPVTFGRSSRRATVRLVAETPDGLIDESHNRYVSGVHFTLMNHGRAVIMRDGGAEDEKGRRVWRKSCNGVAVDGCMSTSDQTLSPGKSIRAVLAPYSVPGGALTLMIEARGHSGSVCGCDRDCELASVAIRRADAPKRAALVVWGAAEIDDLLGTSTGLHIGLIHGRLRIIRQDGSSERLVHFLGGAIPGTSISVQ